MPKESETTSCSCGGELQNLGVLGNLLYSRCRDCGMEHSTRVSQGSLDTFISKEEINTLRECITCKARYAAAGDPDLCPDCHSSFLGRTAASEPIVELSAPVNCDVCFGNGLQVQASYDAKTEFGPWAYVCEDHFNQHCAGLGLGKGQKLIVKGALEMTKESSDNAYPNGELTGLIQQQREDTSLWQNTQNHSPNPNINPAELHADSNVPAVDRAPEVAMSNTIVAKVFTGADEKIEGAKVLLQDGEYQVVGKVELEAEDGFLVEWRTGRKSIEKKANYELVVVAAEGTPMREEWQDHVPAGMMEEDLPENWTPGDCVRCGRNDAMRTHPEKLCTECADEYAADMQADLEMQRQKEDR